MRPSQSSSSIPRHRPKSKTHIPLPLAKKKHSSFSSHSRRLVNLWTRPLSCALAVATPPPAPSPSPPPSPCAPSPGLSYLIRASLLLLLHRVCATHHHCVRHVRCLLSAFFSQAFLAPLTLSQLLTTHAFDLFIPGHFFLASLNRAPALQNRLLIHSLSPAGVCIFSSRPPAGRKGPRTSLLKTHHLRLHTQ